MPNKKLKLGKPSSFYDTFDRKGPVNNKVLHYCPGCSHGVAHKLIAEAMDLLGIADRSVFVSPVGCAVFAFYYFDCGNVQAAHGRAPAVATGIKRANPHVVVISYQGDGDLAGIGANEILQAANRGEGIAVFFINNAIYGMTGGQLAPTTLIGQKTATTPYGRKVANEGYPMQMCEIIATLPAPVYVERVTLSDTKGILKARKAVQTALRAQVDRKGFTFVELLAACPTGWKMEPVKAREWVKNEMEKVFKVGVFRNEIATRPPVPPAATRPPDDELFRQLEVPPGEDKSVPAGVFAEQQVKIAGFGGQGVLMAGIMLAATGMEAGLQVSWIPSYGPEMRGGTANCSVIISDRRIGSPVVDHPHVLIAMNGPSLDAFEGSVRKGGLIIVNSSMVARKVKRTDVTVISAPVTDMAGELGLPAVANMVAIGLYLAHTRTIDVENLVTMIPVAIKKKQYCDLNIAAVRKAVAYLEKNHVSAAR